METLTLEHLAAYLPYGLRMIFEGAKGREITLIGLQKYSEGKGEGIVISAHRGGSMWLEASGFLPILRPLSDLRKDEFFELYLELCDEIDMVRCDAMLNALENSDYYALNIKKFFILEKFMNSNHFDWRFGLIEKGLAIDVNSLQPNNTNSREA